jgi:hypothetical protein
MSSPTTRSIFAIGIACVLAACGGGDVASTPHVGANPVTGSQRSGAISIHIRVPKGRRAHRVRVIRDGRPAYISPSTAGITVAITGPTDLTETAGLLPTSTGCSSALAGTFCTLSFAGLKPCVPLSNCYTATIATYDAVACTPACSIPGGAHELSAAQNVTFSVAIAQANTVNLTLGGIPTSFAVTPATPGYLQGDSRGLKLWGPAAQKLFVVARDAGGNAIVGSGAPVISASPSAANLQVTNPTVSAPNVVTLAAPTFGSPPAVLPGITRLRIAAVPAAQSGGATLVQTVPVAVAHSAIYVSIDTAPTGQVLGFYDGNTGTPNVTIAGANTGLDEASAVAIDGNGTLYVSNDSPASIREFPAGANGNVAPSATIVGASTLLEDPSQLAVQSNGTVCVADLVTNSVFEYAAGSSGNVAPTTTIAGGMTGLDNPIGLGLDSNDTIFVSNFSSGNLVEFPANASGDVTPSISIGGAATGLGFPVAVAVNRMGTIYVADAEAYAVIEFAAGASGNASPIATITGVANPASVALDANGAIYTVASNTSTLLRFAPDANGAATPTVLNSTFGARSVAVVPPML